MLRLLLRALVIAPAVFLAAAATNAPTPRAAGTARIVVGYTKDGFAGAAQLEAQIGATRLARIEQLRADVVELPGDDVADTLELLRSHDAVRYAEVDGVVHALRAPNDPLLSSQWSVTKTHAEQAWDLTTGSADIVVAVVDTGVDAGQPDLRGKLVAGYDYVNGDASPDDDQGHGTAVAGVVAATADNRIGVAGYCWQCRVMPIKVLGADGTGFDSDVAQGIVWATDHGARVVNLSLGGPDQDVTLASAAQYANAHGVLVVAAAGNEGLSTLDYPAALPNVLSVGASNQDDRLYSFSNSGAAVAAPGENSTTGSGGNYVSFTGTSSAAPVVSGIASLAFSLAPSATSDQVRQAIQSTAVPISGVKFGRVDASAAVRSFAASPPAAAPPAPQQSNTPTAGSGTRTTVIAGRLTRARRARTVSITTGAGQLRATLIGSGGVRLRMRLVDQGRTVAGARGIRRLRLHAQVKAHSYRLVVSAAGRKPVRFRLTLSYPPKG